MPIINRRHTFLSRRPDRGVSLIELIVVIAVATLMTGLLMPALRHVHENAHRIICMSHLNQMGQAFVMYTMENKEWLPYSAVLHTGDYPSNLMIARRGGTNGNWDGLGLLYSQGFCPSPECFYCPSHHGNHDYEQYADRWQKPVPGQSIFANYHYAGDIEWANKGKRRTPGSS